MTRSEARTLRAHDTVLDSDGKRFEFRCLDEDMDLVVTERAAANCEITLYRKKCTIPIK